MVLGFGQTKGGPAKAGPARGEDITALITKKQYAKAIELIRSQLKTQRSDPRLRMQLADVLVLAGKSKEAVMILTPVADEFAKEGFAAKAISVLKKIQKIDPSARDVDAKLATLIQEKQRVATIAQPTSSREMPEFGMEEIGIDMGGGSVAVPADDRPVPMPTFTDPSPDELDLGSPREPEPPTFEPAAPEISFVPEPPTFAEPLVEAPAAIALESEPFQLAIDGGDSPVQPDEVVILPEPAPAPPAAARPPSPIVDRDLISDDEEELTEVLPELTASYETGLEVVPEMIPEPPAELLPMVEAEPEPEDQMSESAFAEELLSAIDEAFADLPSGVEDALPGLAQDASTEGGSQIVVSPLFKNFSVDELVEVIHGLNLITFEEGDIIIRQGEPGDSLYMLTAGSVNAFKKNAQGKQVLVSELSEGAFFGEMSILTGKARSATIVAASRCDLLELDRPTLDSITTKHPHVWEVLQEFAEQRMSPRA
jgi:hypothetical protein